MNFDFFCIPGKIIFEIAHHNFDKLFDIVKSTYIEHSNEQSINPKSYFLKFEDKPNARIIALPAALKGENKISGIKWIASYPDNVKKGFPRASAVIILNDYQTGYPLACLEGSIISGLRTACSAVLAAELLHPSGNSPRRLGFIGNGLIARQIYNVIVGRNWALKNILLFDYDAASTQKLKNYINQNSSCKVESVNTPEEVAKEADLLILATTASTPYLIAPNLFKCGQTILNISLRDISAENMINANNIVDDIDHILCADTSLDLAYRKYQRKDFINGTIGDFLLHKVFIDDNKPTIFSPMGMGMLDIAFGHFVYQAVMKNAGKNNFCIDNFFFDLDR